MTTYKDQIEATKAAHMAARALSDAAFVRLESLAADLAAGNLDIDKYAAEARKIVRFSYRESATVARSLTQQQSGLASWKPEGSVSSSDYLNSLIDDVNKNIAEYKSSVQDDKALRRLKLRVRLSATTAAQRGFTDSQLEHYSELQDKGFKVSKLWLANFLNNDPCENCKKLHGTEVEFGKEFPVPTLMQVSVYRDLQGPPLHVHCKCVMVVLITRPDNKSDVIVTNKVTVPTTMSTDTVKRLPRRIFDAIIKALKIIIGGRKK